MTCAFMPSLVGLTGGKKLSVHCKCNAFRVNRSFAQYPTEIEFCSSVMSFFFGTNANRRASSSEAMLTHMALCRKCG